METNEKFEGSVGHFVGEVVESAQVLATRATGAAMSLTTQAVLDARRVGSSFGSLMEASARDGLRFVRSSLAATRDTVVEADKQVRSSRRGQSSAQAREPDGTQA